MAEAQPEAQLLLKGLSGWMQSGALHGLNGSYLAEFLVAAFPSQADVQAGS